MSEQDMTVKQLFETTVGDATVTAYYAPVMQIVRVRVVTVTITSGYNDKSEEREWQEPKDAESEYEAIRIAVAAVDALG